MENDMADKHRLGFPEYTAPKAHSVSAVAKKYDEAVAALRELRCWVGQGMSAESAGAKEETLTDALDIADAVLAKAGVKP